MCLAKRSSLLTFIKTLFKHKQCRGPNITSAFLMSACEKYQISKGGVLYSQQGRVRATSMFLLMYKLSIGNICTLTRTLTFIIPPKPQNSTNACTATLLCYNSIH